MYMYISYINSWRGCHHPAHRTHCTCVICACTYVCAYVCACTYGCAYVCSDTAHFFHTSAATQPMALMAPVLYVHARMCVRMYVHLPPPSPWHLCPVPCVYVCKCENNGVYAFCLHAYTYSHTHIRTSMHHTYAYIYIYIYVCVCVCEHT